MTSYERGQPVYVRSQSRWLEATVEKVAPSGAVTVTFETPAGRKGRTVRARFLDEFLKTRDETPT